MDSRRLRQENNADLTAFKNILSSQSTNASDLELAKKTLAVALNEDLTEKQRKYLTMYYVGRMTMVDIAEAEGVDKSTVSRTIDRGRKRLQKSVRLCFRRIVRDHADDDDDGTGSLIGYMCSR